eukprot:gene17443-biopygen5340
MWEESLGWVVAKHFPCSRRRRRRRVAVRGHVPPSQRRGERDRAGQAPRGRSQSNSKGRGVVCGRLSACSVRRAWLRHPHAHCRRPAAPCAPGQWRPALPRGHKSECVGGSGLILPLAEMTCAGGGGGLWKNGRSGTPNPLFHQPDPAEGVDGKMPLSSFSAISLKLRTLHFVAETRGGNPPFFLPKVRQGTR